MTDHVNRLLNRCLCAFLGHAFETIPRTITLHDGPMDVVGTEFYTYAETKRRRCKAIFMGKNASHD